MKTFIRVFWPAVAGIIISFVVGEFFFYQVQGFEAIIAIPLIPIIFLPGVIGIITTSIRLIKLSSSPQASNNKLLKIILILLILPLAFMLYRLILSPHVFSWLLPDWISGNIKVWQLKKDLR